MTESERLKDDGRLNVNITCLSDGRGIGDPKTIATMVAITIK